MVPPSRIQISHLPIELLSLILGHIDILKLIALRAVCIQWQQVIESLCRLKRSLRFGNFRDYRDSFNTMLNTLWLNLADFIMIDYSEKASASQEAFCAFLLRHFPNVQKLAIEVDKFEYAITKRAIDFDFHSLLTLLDQWQNLTALVFEVIDINFRVTV